MSLKWFDHSDAERVDAVKIDVEDAELDVLRAMESILSVAEPRAPIIETDQSGLRQGGTDVTEVAVLLRKHACMLVADLPVSNTLALAGSDGSSTADAASWAS